MRTVGVVLFLLGLAATCQAQPIHSVCIMPIEDNAATKAMVEKWLQARGLLVVDCMKDANAGDAVLGFFDHKQPVVSYNFFFYRLGHEVTILREVYPAAGITIWLQSHKEGWREGGLFIGRMIFYGQASSLNDGLKKVAKAMAKEK